MHHLEYILVGQRSLISLMRETDEYGKTRMRRDDAFQPQSLGTGSRCLQSSVSPQHRSRWQSLFCGLGGCDVQGAVTFPLVYCVTYSSFPLHL